MFIALPQITHLTRFFFDGLTTDYTDNTGNKGNFYNILTTERTEHTEKYFLFFPCVPLLIKIFIVKPLPLSV